MTPTVDFLREQFDSFNALYFHGKLPQPQFVINNARTVLGQFIRRRSMKGLLSRTKETYTIKISAYYDLTEREYQNTLLHEMIHYYIIYTGCKETSPHGPEFRSMMDSLNARGWNINVTSDVKGRSIADATKAAKPRLVLALRTDSGQRYLSVVNPRYAYHVNSLVSSSHDIVFHKWFETTDTYFNNFPAVRSLRGIRVDEKTFHRFVETERQKE